MESWFLILVSISISLFLKIIFNNFLTTKNLPPGPLSFPFIGHLLWLRMSAIKIEPILRSLHAKFGPMVTLRIGSRPAIFVADRTLAHEALIHGGAVFADRPPAVATRKFVTSNQHNISSSFYGPTWRLLRRNLTAEILHPSRVKSYTHARNWVLQILQNRFESQAKAGRPICVMEHFQYAMFCLLVLMCFGEKLDENQIKKIMEVMTVNFGRFNILNFWPGVTKIVLRNRWRELFRLRRCQENVLIPLIRARKKAKEDSVNHLLQLGTAGTANNCESQWRNKDTRDYWRKKGGDSHNLASITGEKLSDLGALTAIFSNQDDNPIKPITSASSNFQ